MSPGSSADAEIVLRCRRSQLEMPDWTPGFSRYNHTLPPSETPPGPPEPEKMRKKIINFWQEHKQF